MDAAKRQAIEACGNCGQPEDAHKWKSGTDRGDLDLFAALGGPCPQFVASDAAVIYAKYLAITDNRAPQRQPGRVAKRNPLCPRCSPRHRGECVLQPGPDPGPATASRGAARAREALGLTRHDDTTEGT
jgi:hypothetical protein